VPTRVLRFFTVYGPRGRPDMTPSLFVDKMRAQQPITLFNGGIGVYRDWTYVADIVTGVLAALHCDSPFDVFNYGEFCTGRITRICTAPRTSHRVVGSH